MATLTALTISDATLEPTFAATTKAYTASTVEDESTITATAETGATAVIKVNGFVVASGSEASWNEGSNIVTVTVTKTDAETGVYTVVVNKA